MKSNLRLAIGVALVVGIGMRILVLSEMPGMPATAASIAAAAAAAAAVVVFLRHRDKIG